jgi:hypothetical protein
MPNIVLIIGSAPDAITANSWHKSTFSNIVAINNAWKVRGDWDYLIHPEDFPVANRPQAVSAKQNIITADEYVPIQNSYGGFVYAGGTMAFTAAYWALGALKPDILAFIGCDMVYPINGAATHFYGTGAADPLRNDITLQSLEAKSTRLFYLAAQQQCLCLNLSTADQSRMVFPRVSIEVLEQFNQQDYQQHTELVSQMFDLTPIELAIQREQAYAFYVESGRYWENLETICAVKLSDLDGLWLNGLVSGHNVPIYK